MRKLVRFHNNDAGAMTIEYGLMIAILSATLLSAASGFRAGVQAPTKSKPHAPTSHTMTTNAK